MCSIISDQLFQNIDSADNVKEIAGILKRQNMTPYIYVKIALGYLADGQYDKSMKFLEYSRSFTGIYYQPGSVEDHEYRIEMQMISAASVFLMNKFKKLPVNQ